MTKASTVIQSTGSSGHVVVDEFFGVNTLFHNDSVAENSDYNQVIDHINPSLIRFPGGTITEEYFDPTQPNNETATNVLDVMFGSGTPRVRTVTALQSFLENANTHNAAVMIVLPTYRYFDQSIGDLISRTENEIKGFIHNLLEGHYGAASIVGFEIGNEWYQSRFSWSIDEFGHVQHKFAEWIDEVYTELGIEQGPSIYVQAGRSVIENESLAAHFKNDYSIIDGVITHLYGTNSSGNPLGIGSGIATRLEEINDAWSFNGASSLDLVVSEWNVGEDGPQSTIINGIMRYAPLLRIFAEMIEKGVDVAAIWTTQSPGPAGLSHKEGTGSNLTPTGVLFSLMSDHLRGASLVDLQTGSDLLDGRGNQVGYQYLFEAGDDSILYIASGVDDDLTVTLDVTALVGSGTYIYATVLSGAPGDNGTNYDSSAARYIQTAITPTQGPNGQFFITITLEEYRLMQLHFSENHGVEVRGDRTFDISDVLIGSDFADLLEGHRGDDTLKGESGSDTLVGGDGDDVILGGADNDHIFGGDGDDQLEGENGRDSIEGGAGDDTISGGNWHDTLVGGYGDDTVYGGRGNDDLSGGAGEDILVPGSGSDDVDGGADTDIMAFIEHAAFVEATGISEGTFSTGSLSTFTSIEILQLSNYSDVVSGAEFLEEVNLRGGNDILEYSAAGEDFWITDTIFMVQGGAGYDTLSFAQSTSRVSIWINSGVVETGRGHLTFSGFEEFVGSDNGDVISGGLYNDGYAASGRYLTGAGNDLVNLFGGNANYVHTGVGDDHIYMSEADGEIYCGSGNDYALLYATTVYLDGGAGNDFLDGRFAFVTTFNGGLGDDTMIGGTRCDTFVFSDQSGRDTIRKFDVEFAPDLIDLSAVSEIVDFADLMSNHLQETSLGVEITFGQSSIVTIDGITRQDLEANLFLF